MDGKVCLALTLKPWESRIISIERDNKEYNVRNIIEVGLQWSSKDESAFAKPVTQLRNIRVINCHGSGDTMGEFHGFVVDPIKRDVFHFENCSFKTLVGLKVSVEMPVFPNSRGGVRKEIPQLSPSKCRVR